MFSYKTKIFFPQCDPAGVIFFGEVFKTAHECYERFMAENNYEYFLFSSVELAFPIVHTEANYFSPLKLHDNVTLQLAVEKIGNSSFTIIYKFVNGDKLKAEVRTVHVCISRETGDKENLPDKLKNILSGHLAE